MLKRVSSIVVTIAMLLTMVCTFSFASAEGELPRAYLTTETTGKVNPGDKIIVMVNLENYVEGLSVVVAGSYDTNVFSNVEVYGNYKMDVAPNVSVNVPYAQVSDLPGAAGVFAGNATDNGEIRAIWGDGFPFKAINQVCRIELTVAKTAAPGATGEVSIHLDEYTGAKLLDADKNQYDTQYLLTPGDEYVIEPSVLKFTVNCDHQWGNWTHNGAEAPADSAHVRTCSVCGEEESAKCSEGTDTWTVETTEECESNALTTYDCSVCQAHYEVEGEMVEHNWQNPVWVDGSENHQYTCSKCGKTKTEACKDFTESTTDATCTEDAYTEKTCGVCNHTYKTVDEGTATDHTWTHDDATTGAASKHVCEKGDAEEACSFTSVVTDPTCETAGFTTHTCSVCGYSYKDTEVEKLGHKFTNWTHDANEDGTHTHTASCDNGCGATKTEDCEIETVEPTCVADGKESCAICGYEKVLQGGTGEHTGLVIQYKAPTADEAGYLKLVCTDCNTVEEEEVLEGEPFTDIDAKTDVWFYDAAVFCNSFDKIFIGEYGAFNGDDALTRGQVVTVLGRMSGITDEDINGMTEAEFNLMLAAIDELMGNTDVVNLKDLNGSYYDRYAILMAHVGVVKGHDDGTFRGDDFVTREELAAFMMRFLGEDELTFGDAVTFTDMDTVSDWAKDIVAASGECGLFIGDNGAFKPHDTATRAEMATLVERIIRSSSIFPIVDAE